MKYKLKLSENERKILIQILVSNLHTGYKEYVNNDRVMFSVLKILQKPKRKWYKKLYDNIVLLIVNIYIKITLYFFKFL